MYPIKNLFTGKIIGQIGLKDGRLQIEGDFPQKAAMLDLAMHASTIRGEMFEGGIRDELVPLDPAKDLDRVANFVNGSLSDHSVRIINYTEEEEEEDMEDMVKVQSHTREGGKVPVKAHERHEPGTSEKEEENISPEAKAIAEKYDKLIAETDALIQKSKEERDAEKRKKRTDKKNIIRFESEQGILEAFDSGATLEELYTEYSQYNQKAIRELVEEYQSRVNNPKWKPTEDADKALQECVSTKIPIFKKEHPDWTDEHVQAAAFGYCRDKMGMKEPTKDQAFSLLKDSIEVGKGTVFADGTVVFHTPTSTELYGSIEKLIGIHDGEVHVFDDDEPTKVTVYSGNREAGKKPVKVREHERNAGLSTVHVSEYWRGLPKSQQELGEGGKSEPTLEPEPEKDYGTTKQVEERLYGMDARYSTPNNLIKGIRAVIHLVQETYKKGPEVYQSGRTPGQSYLEGKDNPTEEDREKAKQIDKENVTKRIYGLASGMWSYVKKFQEKNKTPEDFMALTPMQGEYEAFEGSKYTGEMIQWLKNMEQAVRHTPHSEKIEDVKDQVFMDCPRRKSLLEDSALVGYTSPSGYLDHTAEITQSHAIKGITVADVILAREMIQDYHVSELPPWIRDQIGNKEFVRVLKPYEELEQTFSGIKEFPTTQFHVEDSFPSMDSPVVLSVVKNIRADPKCRCIRGKIYFVEKNWPAAVMDSVKRGEITAVSIGGSTEFGPGGTFNGQIYDLKQVHIKGGHLAVLPGAEGRCPKGLCGVNLKDAKNRYVGTSNESNIEHVKGHFNNLELTVPSFSQPIFQIADSLKSVIDIKRSNQIEGNTLNTEDVNTMPDNEIVQKLQDALAAKNAELAEVRKELGNFKDSATAKKVKELEVESTAVKDQFAALQKENAKLKDDAAKLEARVKDADTFRHSMYDRALLSTPFYKGKEKELAAMPLDEKAIVFRTAQNLGAVQLADAAILADGFPKPTEAQRQQFMDTGGKSRQKMPSPEVTVPKEGAK